jgi:hypothetical protein
LKFLGWTLAVSVGREERFFGKFMLCAMLVYINDDDDFSEDLFQSHFE